jgi:glycerophosphoryl diester phosphodiesterase
MAQRSLCDVEPELIRTDTIVFQPDHSDGDPEMGSSLLPLRGIGAHRGGAKTHPENTLAAFRNAVALGTHQIEFDVRQTADGEIVVVHDATADRTSDGRGEIARTHLAKLRELDFGRWKADRFAGERIATLGETLDALPRDIWINLQIKKGEPVAADVARIVTSRGRLDQVILACGNAAARTARERAPQMLICNLVRQDSRDAYVDHAIAVGSDFVQFHHQRGTPERALIARAKRAGLRVNYFCSPDGCELTPLFEAGVDFALVDDVAAALEEVRAIGIEPVARG